MSANTSHTAQQNRLQRDLTRYVNGCTLTRSGRMAAMLATPLAYRAWSGAIARSFREFCDSLPGQPAAASVSVRVAPYSGANRLVRRMMTGLAPLREVLRGAYVHGSLATGEECAYSDFDAVVILRDHAVASPAVLARTAAHLNRLRRIMFELDPLQHHGWSVLTEADLRHHCEAHFPTELFRHCAALLPEAEPEIRVVPRESAAELRETFERAVEVIMRRTTAPHLPRNQFELKSVLSQFMLLPALYLQAKSGMPVYKKHSFALARADFTPGTWAPMDEASDIRRDWNVDLSPVARHALTRYVGARRIMTRWFAPATPPPLARRLTPEFWAAAAALAQTMHERLRAVPAARRLP